MIIAHCADWHLGPSRAKLDPETGLNARLLDFARCARFSVEEAVKRDASLILHAGDVFNSCRPTPTEVYLARQALEPAIRAEVPVVIIVGNHDAPRAPSEKHALDLLRGLPGISIIDRPTLLHWRYRQTDQRDYLRPCKAEEPDLQIACLPWPNKQLLLASEQNRKLDPGQLNELIREKMMVCLQGLVAVLTPDVPAVLLGHFSVDMAEAGAQNRLMMLGGEFTLNVHELAALPFAYFALGHVHKPQQVWSDDRRCMVYCGSPEAVTFGEEGEEKSFSLVGIEKGQAGRGVVGTPYRRFVTLEVGEGGLPPVEETEVHDAIVRVRVREGAEVDLGALRRQLEAAGAHEYQIEIQRAETVRRRAVEVSAEMELEQALKAYLEQRPDLKPLTEALIAEARAVEEEREVKQV